MTMMFNSYDSFQELQKDITLVKQTVSQNKLLITLITR